MYLKLFSVLVVLGSAAANVGAQIASPKGYKTPVLILTDRIDKKVSLLEGNVVLVHDGDTFTLVTRDRKTHKIRVWGSDAPEYTQGQAERSKQNLVVLIQGMDVTIAVSGAEVDDAYFGTVYLDGLDVGLMQIESGLAWNSIRNGLAMSEEEGKKYAQAEERARNARLGLWSDRDPIPPWEFRAGNKAVPPAVSPDPRHAAIPSGAASPASAGKIIANLNSGVYHWPGCSSYAKVAEQNRLVFNSRAEAEAAGYRAAKNCK